MTHQDRRLFLGLELPATVATWVIVGLRAIRVMRGSGALVLSALLAVLTAACADPGPGLTVSASAPDAAGAAATASNGPFEFSFTLPRTGWKTSDAITGTATLTVSSPMVVGGSGSGLIGFDIDELGGLGRKMDGAMTLDCGRYQLVPGRPITSAIVKGGAYSPGASGADFYESFFADPLIHLPAGNWTINAFASFISFDDSQSCHLPSYELSAPITITSLHERFESHAAGCCYCFAPGINRPSG
ncbi:MAG: hypothetical protein ACRDGI_01780 [Candidatus Limnocylindrales bacterium]